MATFPIRGTDIGEWYGRQVVTRRHTYLDGTPWLEHVIPVAGSSEPDQASRVTHELLMPKCRRAPILCRGTELSNNNRPDRSPVHIRTYHQLQSQSVLPALHCDLQYR